MASDATYNGRFYTGVHSTGIYCLPSCRARKPKAENVQFYPSIEEARGAGLRPCLKCRPDDFAAGHDPDRERLVGVIEAMRAHPGDFASVDRLADAAMMSPSAFYAAVRRHYHRTPKELLTEARVRFACRRLRETSGGVGEVGADAGFESTSAYYENFGRLVGMAPAAYRRLEGAHAFSMELPSGFQASRWLAAIGRDPASVTERVVGDELIFTAGGGVVRAKVSDREAQITLHGGDATTAHTRLSRMLGLSQQTRAFEEHVDAIALGRLVEGRRGLRIPQTPTPFEGVVWSIVGQQVNLPFAYALRRRLAEGFGPKIGEMFEMPDRDLIANLNVDDLLPLQYSRRKAEYLIGAAQTNLDLEALADAPASVAEKTLLEQRGIGPWSANYLMMRSLGFPDCVPLGDTGLTSALARFFDVPRPGPEETLRLMEPFRPFRSLATFQLWQSLSD